jgi:hypothetical protein
MGTILTIVAGLVVWVVLWAIDVKGFDAFLITCVFLLLAAAGRIVMPLLPGARSDDR